MPSNPRTSRRSFFDLTPQQYQELSDAKALSLEKLADRQMMLQARYAQTGMVGAIMLLLSCVGAFVYLVMNQHPTEAYFVLGGAVLTLITRILSARL
ncbi:hypothetical protein DYQ86_10985 [Acidobacteria bacterium AB60]|nr:hypothetical protein DYQ86_10985 [Acidobacteria bacterium AB60]